MTRASDGSAAQRQLLDDKTALPLEPLFDLVFVPGISWTVGWLSVATTVRLLHVLH